MPLSDKWTRAELRTVVRRELLDPTGRFWSDAELNSYLSDWQSRLQEEFEFVWGTATYAYGTATDTGTVALSSIASDILRLDAVYWNSKRIGARTEQDLEEYDRDWRWYTNSEPTLVYQSSNDPSYLGLWPTPTADGTLVLEYPTVVSFASDSSPMSLPAWTRYSAAQYCAFRAYQRAGPNQDTRKALRKKSIFTRQCHQFKSILASIFPVNHPYLRPGGKYEIDILDPFQGKAFVKDVIS